MTWPCSIGQHHNPHPHPFPQEPYVMVHFLILPHIHPEDGDVSVHRNTKTASHMTWLNPESQGYALYTGHENLDKKIYISKVKKARVNCSCDDQCART
jgi:hypothetical protein